MFHDLEFKLHASLFLAISILKKCLTHSLRFQEITLKMKTKFQPPGGTYSAPPEPPAVLIRFAREARQLAWLVFV